MRAWHLLKRLKHQGKFPSTRGGHGGATEGSLLTWLGTRDNPHGSVHQTGVQFCTSNFFYFFNLIHTEKTYLVSCMHC